jgi:Holliday junction resolvase RusA-like endonuclease
MYKRSKTGGVFCDPSVKEFKVKVKLLLKELKFVKTNGPVKIAVEFYFKRKNRDIDNLLKILLDSMNKIIYDDDKQVHCINAVNLISYVEKTVVRVYEITEIVEFN